MRNEFKAAAKLSNEKKNVIWAEKAISDATKLRKVKYMSEPRFSAYFAKMMRYIMFPACMKRYNNLQIDPYQNLNVLMCSRFKWIALFWLSQSAGNAWQADPSFMDQIIGWRVLSETMMTIMFCFGFAWETRFDFETCRHFSFNIILFQFQIPKLYRHKVKQHWTF